MSLRRENVRHHPGLAASPCLWHIKEVEGSTGAPFRHFVEIGVASFGATSMISGALDPAIRLEQIMSCCLVGTLMYERAERAGEPTRPLPGGFQ